MKYLDVNWRLVLDPETRIFMDSAYSEDIDKILEKIAEGVKDGFSSGLFTIERE
jgi:hypothetical protein